MTVLLFSRSSIPFNHAAELLRRSAENTMHSVVRAVFARLHVLDPCVEEEKLAVASDETTEGEIKMTVSTQEIPMEATATKNSVANKTKEDEATKDQQETVPEAEYLTEVLETEVDRVKPASVMSPTTRPACKCLCSAG